LVKALTILSDDKNRIDVNIIPITKIMDVIIDNNDLVGIRHQPTLYSVAFATTEYFREKTILTFKIIG